jgi:glycosyltransferase involved in cell wall biosynthesis
MRILYITEIYPDPERGLGVWGGGEKQFYEISRRIAKRGHDVTVLTCRFQGQPAKDVIEGVKIQRLGLTREAWTGSARKTLPAILSYILKTAKAGLKIKPDVVHCNTYFPIYPGEIIARLNNVPIVSTFHDIYGLRGWIESQESAIWGFLGHLTTIMAARFPHDRIICVSPQCKQKLINLGVRKNKITVIPNGVDIALFDSVRVEKVHHQILYVGRLVNFKHVDWLIKAFSQVVKEVPDARLKIVGHGPERGNLELLAKNLGLKDRITFTGVTPTYEEVAKYYKESEVFVLPSTVEGEAIVLKEAMAASLPVIAMKVRGSGVLSLVRNGENGFLIEPSRQELMAKYITKLLLDQRLRNKMGQAGRNFVEKFDWEVIANLTLEIYQELIGRTFSA